MTSFWAASHSQRLAHGASPGLWDHLLCSLLHTPHKPPIPTPAATDCSRGIACSPTTHFCSCSSLGPEYPSLLSLHCPHQILTNTISFLGPSLRNQGPGFLPCVVTHFFPFKASGIICIYVALPSLSLLPYLAGTHWVLSVCVSAIRGVCTPVRHAGGPQSWQEPGRAASLL